jgi:hypothetical protein
MKTTFWTFVWVVSFFKWAGGIFEDQKGNASWKRIAGFAGLYMMWHMVKNYSGVRSTEYNSEMFLIIVGFTATMGGLAMLEWLATFKEKKEQLLADTQKPETVKLAEIQVEQTKAENATELSTQK